MIQDRLLIFSEVIDRDSALSERNGLACYFRQIIAL